MSVSSPLLNEIAKPYANALFDLALEQGDVDDTEKALLDIHRLVQQSHDFNRFLTSPLISRAQQGDVVETWVKHAKFSHIVSNFLRLLVQKRRLFVLGDCIAVFKKLVADHRGEVTAHLVSAEELTAAQLDKLGAALKNKLGKDVSIDTCVDPSLIGGLIVRVGSQMIDSSLRTKLDAMKIAMKEVR